MRSLPNVAYQASKSRLEAETGEKGGYTLIPRKVRSVFESECIDLHIYSCTYVVCFIESLNMCFKHSKYIQNPYKFIETYCGVEGFSLTRTQRESFSFQYNREPVLPRAEHQSSNKPSLCCHLKVGHHQGCLNMMASLVRAEWCHRHVKDIPSHSFPLFF